MSKSVLITGAAYGIGAATAELFARNGYDVIVNYNTSTKDAEATAAKCREAGAQSWAIQADVSDEADLAKLAKQVADKVGRLDVLINNAAFTDEPKFEKTTKTDIMYALEQNFVTAVLTIRTFVPDLMKPQASVLNVSSVFGLDQSGDPDVTLYSASKAAIINLTQTLAKMYAPHIRFNAVAPGRTRTPSWEGTSVERKKFLIDVTPMKQWVEAEEIAQTLLFLAQTKHIDSETIVVDAGWSKRDDT